MKSDQRMARIAGVFYLVIIVCAGVSEGYVRGSVIVPGDATATANNIIQSESLYRLGFVFDLVAFLCDLVVSIIFYFLFRPVSKVLSMISASLRLLAHPAIASVNLLNHYLALQLLDGSDYLNVFTPDQLNALVLLFLDTHTIGYLVAGVFFGAHCLLLGYLLVKSVSFPGVLGYFMIIASLGYLLNSFGNFIWPDQRALFDAIVVGPAVVAELSLCLWLMIKGVRQSQVSLD